MSLAQQDRHCPAEHDGANSLAKQDSIANSLAKQDLIAEPHAHAPLRHTHVVQDARADRKGRQPEKESQSTKTEQVCPTRQPELTGAQVGAIAIATWDDVQNKNDIIHQPPNDLPVLSVLCPHSSPARSLSSSPIPNFSPHLSIMPDPKTLHGQGLGNFSEFEASLHDRPVHSSTLTHSHTHTPPPPADPPSPHLPQIGRRGEGPPN